MKLFDIVNTKDEIISYASDKECHSNPDLIHRVVHFTLIDIPKQKILISKRSENVKFDSGLWCFMGEHLLQGDDYSSAVLKGLKDELDFADGEIIAEKASTIFYQPQQTEFARFFIAYYKEGKLSPNPAEISEIKWISLNEILEDKFNFSKMTQYWIENVDWKEVFDFYKKNI